MGHREELVADNVDINQLADNVFGREHPIDPREQIRVLQEVAPFAEELGKLAFEEKNKDAWKRVQDGIFDLPSFSVSSGKKTESRRRPFIRGDLLASGICEIIWAIEEQSLPRLVPPEPLTGEAAGEFLEAEFRKRSVRLHPMFEFIATADLSEAQVRAAALAYLNSVMVRIRTVHRSIMLVQLPMEFHDCIKLSPLVVDELGAGELEKAHAQRTAVDIEKWGGTVDWHAPVDSTEMKAMLNWNLRTVTHPNSLWSYCGIFCVEWNSYLELRAALLALRKRGVPDEMMEVLVQHGDGDPYDQDGHALLVRQELGRRIETPEDCELVYTGLAYHQSLYHAFFEGEHAKLRAQVEAAG
jgi:hypothetical protein